MVAPREMLADRVLDELRPGLSNAVLDQIDDLSSLLASAGRIVCYGVGREGLMIKALAMRLFHLGLDVHVVGDMTVPPVADGDVLFLSAGPGDFSTVTAFAQVARNAGAGVLCITAAPDGAVPLDADLVIHLPAQTMASDQRATDNSVLPMGSLFEVLMLVFLNCSFWICVTAFPCHKRRCAPITPTWSKPCRNGKTDLALPGGRRL